MKKIKWIFFDVGSTLVDETAAYDLCGDVMEADSPYVICPRCLRDIREIDIASTREVPSA